MEMIIHFLQLSSAAFLGVRLHASGLCCFHPPSLEGLLFFLTQVAKHLKAVLEPVVPVASYIKAGCFLVSSLQLPKP